MVEAGPPTCRHGMQPRLTPSGVSGVGWGVHIYGDPLVTKQQKRLAEIFKNLVAWCDNDENANLVADGLDSWLDDLGSDDCFGTERQNDPRGDGREGDPAVRQKRTW